MRFDEQVEAFRSRPLEGRYLSLARCTVEKLRDRGRVVRKSRRLGPASTAASMFPPLAVQTGGRGSTVAWAAGKDLVLSLLEES